MINKIRFLIKNQGLMKYFKNTIWLFGERIFTMSISFFVIIALTRYLGPERFGLLSYSKSFIGIFTAFTSLGLNVILVRELVNDKEKNDRLIGTALLMKLVTSTIAIAIIFIINLSIEDKEAVYLTNIIAFTLIFQSLNSLDTYFQANVISKYSVLLNLIAFLVSSFVKLGLIFFKVQLIYFAYAIIFDSFVVSLGYLYIYTQQKKSLISLKYDKEIAIYYIKNGWPLVMVALAASIYTRTDQVMMKYLIGNEAVGNYAAAIRISELFYFIPLLITQSIFPKLVEIKKQSTKKYFNLLEKLYKILVWSAIPIALGLFIFSDLIISILYGEKFSQSSSILNILAFSIIFIALGSITTKVLYIEHYERKYLYRSFLGVFVNIGLNFYLISIYGAKGAAISTLITLFIIYYIYDLIDKDLHKFYYLKLKCFIPIHFK